MVVDHHVPWPDRAEEVGHCRPFQHQLTKKNQCYIVKKICWIMENKMCRRLLGALVEKIISVCGGARVSSWTFGMVNQPQQTSPKHEKVFGNRLFDAYVMQFCDKSMHFGVCNVPSSSLVSKAFFPAWRTFVAVSWNGFNLQQFA